MLINPNYYPAERYFTLVFYSKTVIINMVKRKGKYMKKILVTIAAVIFATVMTVCVDTANAASTDSTNSKTYQKNGERPKPPEFNGQNGQNGERPKPPEFNGQNGQNGERPEPPEFNGQNGQNGERPEPPEQIKNDKTSE